MCLEKAKVKKMIKDYLAGKLDLPQDAFKTLCITFNSLSETVIVQAPIIPITRLNPPKQTIKTKTKKSAMAECINDMLSHPLFVHRKMLCETC